jgi:hypothetical protein
MYPGFRALNNLDTALLECRQPCYLVRIFSSKFKRVAKKSLLGAHYLLTISYSLQNHLNVVAAPEISITILSPHYSFSFDGMSRQRGEFVFY